MGQGLRTDLLVLGAVLWDMFDDRKLIGGAPFNVAAHATRLGIPTVFVSAVGDDELGGEALEKVAQLGLDTRHIRTVAGKPTGTVRVFLNEGQPDYDIKRPAAYDYPEIADGDLQKLAEIEPAWIYFGTLEPMNSTFLRVMRRLLGAIPDARRFYDVNLRKESYTAELIEILLAEATVLKVNDSEVEAIRDILDIRDSGDEEFCKVLNTKFNIECVCDPWREKLRHLEKRRLRGVTR
jgi:fructokinase